MSKLINYQPSKMPVNKHFRDMSKPELREYFDWFLSQIDVRIEELTRVVQATDGFSNWEPDFSKDSLNSLSVWFKSTVTTEAVNRDPVKLITGHEIDVDQWDLSNETFSLCRDIGMYFGKTMLTALPNLIWQQELSNKKMADYGEVVLKGNDLNALNPVSTIVTIAYGFARNTSTPDKTTKVFEVWFNILSK